MTRRELALHLLRKAGQRGVTTGDFIRAGVGSRYSARLLELRRLGHRIESHRIREGSWRYILKPQLDIERGGASDPTDESSPAPSPGAETLFDIDTPVTTESLNAALHDYER